MITLYSMELPGSHGRFELRPVSMQKDLSMVWRWWNAEHARGKWSLDIRLGEPQHEGGMYMIDDLRSYLGKLSRDDDKMAVIGLLDGTAMSYWEVYDVASSPLACHSEVEPGDRGIHVLIGEEEFVGRGLGPYLLAAVAEWQFAAYPKARRVVGEPNAKNSQLIRAAIQGGAEEKGIIRLPHKDAVLIAVERSSIASLITRKDSRTQSCQSINEAGERTVRA